MALTAPRLEARPMQAGCQVVVLKNRSTPLVDMRESAGRERGALWVEETPGFPQPECTPDCQAPGPPHEHTFSLLPAPRGLKPQRLVLSGLRAPLSQASGSGGPVVPSSIRAPHLPRLWLHSSSLRLCLHIMTMDSLD